jgi:alpha,alpha-trehalose phosphorylase
MAQLNLRYAAEVAGRHSRAAARLGVNAEEMASWRDAAKSMRIPFDEVLGVHPQSEGFTHHEVWDFEGTPADKYPLLLNYPYFDLYRKQVIKQADLVLAMQLRPDAFTPEQMARNFAYYEAVTVRDSSLSACTQAMVAARTGHLDLAYDYLAEAALVDLNNLAGNTDHGVHIASMAGTWNAVVAGFGGMEFDTSGLSFAPQLPPALSKISFGLGWQGRQLRVSDHRGRGGVPAGRRPADAAAPPRRAARARRRAGGAPLPEPPVVDPVEQPYGRAPQARHPGQLRWPTAARPAGRGPGTRAAEQAGGWRRVARVSPGAPVHPRRGPP